MAFLMLADGTCFYGTAVGAKAHAVGEVVFNTSLFGYQEILTDPSYYGQIINFTSPHIGNVGINHLDYESQQVHATGAVFKSFSDCCNHWQAGGNLGDFLLQQNIVAISDIDTRALTLHLREYGSQFGCIVANDAITLEQARFFAQEKMAMPLENASALVSTKESYCYAAPSNHQAHIVVIDCGVKAGILKSLAGYGVRITVVPESIQINELNRLQPDGVLLSNGPGDPQTCISLIQLTRELLQAQIPIFGICLGHQILALAAGANIKKMKFGHHGANHPIKCLQTETVFISSQNHSFVVDEASLPICLNITHVSLFDKTIAGLEHKGSPAFSFQGHPEANPGPKELVMLFKKFIDRVHHA
jgi:carbamoyl-phosphate synthase small subunit